MKKHFYILLMALLALPVLAAAQAKTTIGVTSIEANGVGLVEDQASALVRIELGKVNTYAVIDKYDIAAALKKANLDPDNCLGKSCAVEAGKLIGAQKMVTGTIDHFGQKIIVSFQLIDVAAGAIEKTQVDEYLYLPEYIQEIVGTSIARLCGGEVNQEVATKLTKPDDYESEINNPGEDRLRLNGPRMGVSFMTGSLAKRFMAPKSEGGFNEQPFMFIFGYQQEIQYLNSGKYQALFEFVPAVIGLDKGLFIPSISFMNGLRNNINGWEFGIGPNVTFVRTARGFYTSDNKWHQEYEASLYDAQPGQMMEQLDYRGTVKMKSAFIFAVGKSFKSGRMNIPVNAYFIPTKGGTRIGVTFGFNGKRGR